MAKTAFQPLTDFETNTYSQYGEDGVVTELLRRIASATSLDKWCVEFGAWDGLHLSNTARLLREDGYAAVLIEGNPKKYKELCVNFPDPKVVKKCEFVDFEGPKSLENILLATEIPREIDFLSIDIDGNDFHILKSLTQIRPKIICIEFNAAIPNEVEFVQTANFRVNVGSSGRSIITLGQQKGYNFAHATKGNVFLVRDDLIDAAIGASRPTLDELIDDTETRNFIFVGMDGSIHTSQPVWMPWHKLRVTERGIQALPRFLIRFRSDYNPLQKIAFFAFRAFSNKVKKEKR
ncbi:MAG: FkbM family methyltransferase [Rhodobacterales bacterium]